MKKVLLFLFIASLSFGGFAQNDIIIGKIDSVTSEILKEDRKIWVHLPENFSPAKQYPVVYLLDGDAHFYSVVGMIHQLSSVNGNTICPEMIVVGIPNTNRTRDLTPYKGDANDPFLPPEMLAISGGGENFVSFIEKELIPFVDANYPTAPYRMLIGHSFGGLTALNIFLHHNDLFNAYVAIDPSVNWANKRLLHEFESASLKAYPKKKALYIGIANIETGKTMEAIKADTTFVGEHTNAIFALDAHLRKYPQDNLRYQSKFYGNDTHGSSPLITEYDALHFIFDFYPLNFSFAEYMDPEMALAEQISQHFRNVSSEFGYEVKPDEGLMNGFGYEFLSMQQLEKAKQFFEMNVANYPESANVYDSLGDYYSAIGEKQQAIECFQKALTLDEAGYTREKLEALQKE
jgi:predicted alpha/beta superfamily hydrolase